MDLSTDIRFVLENNMIYKNNLNSVLKSEWRGMEDHFTLEKWRITIDWRGNENHHRLERNGESLWSGGNGESLQTGGEWRITSD